MKDQQRIDQEEAHTGMNQKKKKNAAKVMVSPRNECASIVVWLGIGERFTKIPAGNFLPLSRMLQHVLCSLAL